MTDALFAMPHVPPERREREGVLRAADYAVRDADFRAARRLVGALHYAGSASNSATFLHGLYRRDDPSRLLGVAWWIPPTRDAAAASWDGPWQGVLTLSRLVLDPEVPKNGATFLLARSVRLIAADGRFGCLVTYADTWRGHTGGIYRAAGWEYVGLTTPESVWVDSDGRMVARKASQRTRTKAEMVELGYRFAGRHAKHKFRRVLRRPTEGATP